ncbi:YggS family pyridoxal phosphate-dependent enzyme [Chitiniphilus eburneus]|uniref:Pyridoxal phosphate homeostasis protein n=1 Tax=Chitiniphilus eburneus TaxID=2571148 RepID=A0A4U0Q474_9NEIS|nr:YggS family pyridoxal phosphate-dependent enzyme [Chitiniphilus eburneus]TJZ75510.1 YggS family pyridoxal phosphate-dependent enzyme [Chitiniphilus eburneus]
MATIFTAWQGVLTRMAKAAQAAGRSPESVHLLAVGKTFPAESIRELHGCGQRAFGENYVQELTTKARELADLPGLAWHFIGPLQSNKTRHVAEIAAWVHTVDRLKIAERLAAQRPESLPPLNVCIQVNVSGEASKSGVEPKAASALAHAMAALPRLRLRGLMCIPEPTGDDERLRAQFATLAALKQQLEREGLVLDTLSMGMSADLDLAIREGATIVRVGTALFGARTYNSNQDQGIPG